MAGEHSADFGKKSGTERRLWYNAKKAAKAAFPICLETKLFFGFLSRIADFSAIVSGCLG